MTRHMQKITKKSRAAVAMTRPGSYWSPKSVSYMKGMDMMKAISKI